jgi:hypothetical protein
VPTLPAVLPFLLGEEEPPPGVAGKASSAQGATVDVTVRLQALDGTWETCGADRAIGVDPESLETSYNEWGPDKASFDLHRSPIAIWPDIGSFSPVEVEVGGVIVWEGRTGETPMRSGAESVIGVHCDGWQYHTDDDVYQRAYVHSKLTDWKDARSPLEANLAAYTSAPQVQVGSGLISLTWPQGQATNGIAGVMLDMGVATLARRVVLDWSTTAGAANRAMYLAWGSAPAPPTGVENTFQFSSAVGAESGTLAFTLPAGFRYLFIRHDANSHTPAADETLKITRALVFADTTYESGNASVLHASTIVPDALTRATMLLSGDFSQIAATSFDIRDFVLSKLSTPRHAIEAANAYHNWVAKLLIGRRMQFKARPSVPQLEIGAWSGSDTEDRSANAGAEIYNRAIVEATGPDGSPLSVERTASEQPGTLFLAGASPAPDNPSFAVDTTSWSTNAGTITRNTEAANYDSSPASGKWQPAGYTTLTETFTGTFLRGATYRLTFWLKGAKENCEQQFGTATDYARRLGVVAVAGSKVTIVWTPSATTTGVTLRLLSSSASSLYVDSLLLMTAKPTLADRRGFRRTKTIEMSSAITPAEGNQIADVFLQAHMTTPFKGETAVSPGGARRVLGGQPVHPSQLGLYTQELVRLSELIDPDTGGVGRDATIAAVSYTHRDQKAKVTLDDARGNFEALIARLDVVQSVGT